jgi:phenylacetate-CoA oxygenase PaaI subunit
MTEKIAPLYRTVDDLDPAAASALLQFGLALADTKHCMGRRLSEWVNGAPALEASVGAAAMTQDELGHARSLYVILRDLPGAPPELGTETDLDRADFFNPALLDTPYPAWFDVIAALVLLDQSLTVVIESTRESAFAPLQQRAGKILQEESFHRIFGESWLARLAGGETHAKMQSAVERIWNVADNWFGPPDDSALAALVGGGILSSSPETLRAAWLGRVSPLLQKNGLAIPDAVPAWERWEAARREVRSG